MYLPEHDYYHVLTRRHFPGIRNEEHALRKALRNPIGSRSLLDCIHKNDTIAIIVTDNTRPFPEEKVLPVLLQELEQKISRKNILIIIALGLHSPLSHDEMCHKFGQVILENYKIINHDPENTTFLGVTTRGTPIEINKYVIQADFRISTGFIEPHFFAGFSGGRKSIAPGVSSERAILHNHSYHMIAHPRARAGILKSNPVHEDMIEQAHKCKLDFILNVILNQEHKITHIFAGNPWLAHEIGCQVESEIAGSELCDQVDICIVTNGGAPLDLDFYQTCKGIDTAAQITRDGGVIIAVSSCIYGVGPEFFYNLHVSASSPIKIIEILRQAQDQLPGWQNYILARAQLRHTIMLLSSLPDEIVREMKVIPIHSLEEGLERAKKIVGNSTEVAIIPEGPLVIPLVRGKY